MTRQHRQRIRAIKPEAQQDERIGRLPREARLLFFAGIVTLADDEGRLRAMPSLLIGHTFPYDDDVTPAKLRRWLDAIEREHLILRYEHDGTPYIAIRRWAKHQRINRATASLLPPPPDPDVVSANSVEKQGANTSSSLNEHGEDLDDSPPRAQARVPDPDPDPSVAVEDDAREPERHDVDQLCRRLASRMLVNDAKAKVSPDSAGWRDQARLLLDRDGRPLEEAYRVIDWCQADSFWRSNILSMRKLREQYPKLLLRMNNPPAGKGASATGWTSEEMLRFGQEAS